MDPIGHHDIDFRIGDNHETATSPIGDMHPGGILHTSQLGPGDVYHGPVIVDEEDRRPGFPSIPDLHGRGGGGSTAGAFVGDAEHGDIHGHGGGAGAASGGWHEE